VTAPAALITGGGGRMVVVVVLIVVRCAERKRGVVRVGEGELTRWTIDRITFEERPLVVIAINGKTVVCGGWFVVVLEN